MIVSLLLTQILPIHPILGQVNKSGVYMKKKPVEQTAFERELQKSLDSVSDYYPHMKELDLIAKIEDSQYEPRPRVYDGKSKLWVLFDTGAAVSVLPYRQSLTYSGQEPERHRALEAVNGTKLKTYGREFAKV